jgi:uncharacterized protein (TIGR03067 family)
LTWTLIFVALVVVAASMFVFRGFLKNGGKIGSLLPGLPAASAEAPASLQGRWRVPPSYNPQRSETSVRIQITGTEYVWLYEKESGLKGIYDASGYHDTVRKDFDGVEVIEGCHYGMRIGTNTSPWQIDLIAKNKENNSTESKGICEVRGDTLKIKFGKPGDDRPTTFVDAVQATRVVGPK